MNIYINNESPLFMYFAIPKSGSSSIRRLLSEDHEIKWGRVMPISLGIKYGSYYKFTIVRNPWERVVSVFYDKLYQHPRKVMAQKGRKDIYLQDCQKLLLRTLGKEQDIGALLEISFDDFVMALKKVSGKDIHFMPQYDMLKPYMTSGSKVNVFHMEAFDEVIPFLKERLSLTGNIKHLNRTAYFHSDDVWSEETKKAVAEIYKDDIEKFSYVFPWDI